MPDSSDERGRRAKTALARKSLRELRLRLAGRCPTRQAPALRCSACRRPSNMPLIDQLLQVVHDKGGAEACLVLEPGRAARLRAGGGERTLTRGALDPATIHRMLQELAPGKVPAASAAAERLELRHSVGPAEFVV